MPFFALDDGAHSHPKFMRAGNAAVGLWSRIGSYVAQHLTDGHVPGAVASMYGTAPQIKKLVAVGLWHEHAHVCPRCPQPRPGDFFMHDYKESGNPSRVEVLQRRAKQAEKKRKYRAENAAGSDSQPNQMRFDDELSANRDRFDDGSSSNESPDFDKSAGHNDMSRGDSLGTSRARVPLHSTPLPKEGVEEREQSAGSRARAPEPALSLIAADWTPSRDDVQAAQIARSDAGRSPLTVEQLDAVTRKFVRRQLDDGRTAAAWGGRWRQWAENERVEPVVDLAGGNVLHLPAARGTQQNGRPVSTADQRAAAAFALSAELAEQEDGR